MLLLRTYLEYLLLPSRKKNIGRLSREEVWREAEGFNGQKIGGSHPRKDEHPPCIEGEVSWMGKARNDSKSYPD